MLYTLDVAERNAQQPRPVIDPAFVAYFQGLPPAEQDRALREIRTLLEPAYPGGTRNHAATYSCLNLTGEKYSPQRILEEFAGARDGTEEFPQADHMRHHVRARLAGARPEKYLTYLTSVAANGVLLQSARGAHLQAMLIYELEHLPGHMQFFQQYKDTEWVKHYTPGHIMRAAFYLLTDKINRRYDGPVRRKARDNLRAYLCRMKLEDLESACLAGDVRNPNHLLLCEFAARGAEKNPALAAAVVDRELGAWLRMLYTDRGHDQRYGPAAGLVMVTSRLLEHGITNPGAVLRLTLRTLEASGKPEDQASLANMREGVKEAIKKGGRALQDANKLLRLAPMLGQAGQP